MVSMRSACFCARMMVFSSLVLLRSPPYSHDVDVEPSSNIRSLKSFVYKTRQNGSMRRWTHSLSDVDSVDVEFLLEHISKLFYRTYIASPWNGNLLSESTLRKLWSILCSHSVDVLTTATRPSSIRHVSVAPDLWRARELHQMAMLLGDGANRTFSGPGGLGLIALPC